MDGTAYRLRHCETGERKKKGENPTFDQYNMFEWTSGIQIMDEIIESKDRSLNE